MRVQSIEASSTQILLRLSEPASGVLLVRETVPTIGVKPGRILSMTQSASESVVVLSRFSGAHDRLCSEFTVFFENAAIPGVRYVTELAPGFSENDMPYPQPDSIKALHGTPEDVRALGIRQAPCNINLPALMTTRPGPGALPFEHDGRTYFFVRSAVEALDEHMREMDRMGVLVTMILLNAPKLFGSTGERALLDACIHPGYDASSPDAFISAFDMRTEEGQCHYRAFVDFLAGRYTRVDRKYGRAGGAIISNEVDSQYVWGNAGEMTVNDYTREYTEAMRLAWLCGRKHASFFRVYLSLDQFWSGAAYRPNPLRYYAGRDAVDCIQAHAARDGDFPWFIAYHPYPEDLRWADFWHDRAPDFTYTTPKITFKNIEVLPAYLSQERFLYKGEPRRIVFSEQGFNSQDGPLKELTERMAEAGYVLAMLKARALPTVDMLMHHAYVDNPHEFGLNLGIRRYDPDAPHHAGAPKPIYGAVRDMGTEREAERVAKARAFIGEELFDYLLDPPVVYGDRDMSKDGQFG